MKYPILFPTDFSESAMVAFVFALRLAEKTHCPVTTVHIHQQFALAAAHMRNTLAEIMEADFFEEFETYKDTATAMRKLAEKLQHGGVELRHVMHSGEKIVRSILAVEAKEQPFMIVMGTEGAKGWKAFLQGSVAGEVMENAACPVLAIPKEVNLDRPLRRIAFGTSYQAEERAALEVILDLAQLIGAEVHCVHVRKPGTGPAEGEEAWKKAFRGREGLVCHHDIIGDSIPQVFEEFVEDQQIDILATLIHERSMVREVFDHSLTKRLSYHLNFPVLAIPEKALE